MFRTAIIGIGSAQGSDRLGWCVIERLQEAGFDRRFEPGTVSLLTCRFPAQLVNVLKECDHAVVIDAVRQPAGQLTEFSTKDLVQTGDSYSSHGIGVGEALALAGELLPGPVPVTILGIGTGQQIDNAMPDVDALMPALQEQLADAIQAFRHSRLTGNQSQ